jgi:hypothetical protein
MFIKEDIKVLLKDIDFNQEKIKVLSKGKWSI